MTKPVRLTWPIPARLLRSWGEKGLMAVAIVVAVIGLSRLEFPATGLTCGHEADEPGGSGIVIHSELLHVWLPATFAAFAADTRGYSAAPTHKELRKFLERGGHESLWYAVTIRGYQANGGMEDIAFIRFPYRDPEHFSEFQEVLAMAAGKAQHDPNSQCSGAEFHFLPVELSELAPREAFERFSRRSSLLRNSRKHQVTD
jgi:hypothetical protein